MNKIVTKEILVEKLAESLEIAPSQYQEAIKRFNNLKKYFENTLQDVDIYLQGSFKLGTTIRPIKQMEEQDYDIDIVCELSDNTMGLKEIKNSVGDILKSSVYNKYLDEEGKRCWTLNYKENDYGEGFHIDILPCVKESQEKISKMKSKTNYPELLNTSIKITNKVNNDYEEKTSNPSGIFSWFNEINAKTRCNSILLEKAKLYETNKSFFNNNLNIYNIEEISDSYIKTPLQQVIQILKRHRDVMFSDSRYNEDYKPISVIITILAANIASNNIGKFKNTYELLNIVINSIKEYTQLTTDGVDSEFLKFGNDKNLIIKKPNMQGWYIANPANPDENLADKWHENSNSRAKAFFEWVNVLESNLSLIINETDLDKIKPILSYTFGKQTTEKVISLCDKWIEENQSSNQIYPTKPWSL